MDYQSSVWGVWGCIMKSSITKEDNVAVNNSREDAAHGNRSFFSAVFNSRNLYMSLFHLISCELIQNLYKC